MESFIFNYNYLLELASNSVKDSVVLHSSIFLVLVRSTHYSLLILTILSCDAYHHVYQIQNTLADSTGAPLCQLFYTTVSLCSESVTVFTGPLYPFSKGGLDLSRFVSLNSSQTFTLYLQFFLIFIFQPLGKPRGNVELGHFSRRKDLVNNFYNCI